jgi:hypothetical protein
LGDLVIAEAEESHQVRMGAETAVAHADAVFCRQPGSHESVGDAFKGESRNRQGVGAAVRSENVHARDARQPGLLPVRERGPDDLTELDEVDRPATGPRMRPLQHRCASLSCFYRFA